jgi:regulatory protein
MTWTRSRRGFEDLEPPRDGEPLDPELDEPADPEVVARTICLRLLDARARTRAELATELSRRRVPAPVAATVLDRFTELGLIDDAAFAGSFALARHSERGQAGRAIAVALRRRGVADEVIEDAIAQIDPASEVATARQLARTRLARMGTIDAITATRRLTGLLARRGYSAEVVRDAVRAVVSEQHSIELVDD